MHHYKKKHVIIVAAGKSSRLGSDIPKQFIILHGKPLLYYAIMAFSHLSNTKFTVVLPEKSIQYWKELTHNLELPEYNIAVGGPTRFHSVKSGLKFVSNDEIVLVHDAARPLVNKQTIKNVIETTLRKGNAVPAVNVSDTIREVSGMFNRPLLRQNLKAIQTPQGFTSSVIQKAYGQSYHEDLTDDASVVESINYPINIVEGNIENIKVTTEIDIILAGELLRRSF